MIGGTRRNAGIGFIFLARDGMVSDSSSWAVLNRTSDVGENVTVLAWDLALDLCSMSKFTVREF